MEELKNRFIHIKKVVADKHFKDQHEQLEQEKRANVEMHIFALGDLVYLWAPSATTLNTQSKKFVQEWIGPLQIQAIYDDTHFGLADWYGNIIPFFGTVHRRRLRPCYVNLGKIEGRKLATAKNSQHLLNELNKLELGDP
jgi:hypothetical protein